MGESTLHQCIKACNPAAIVCIPHILLADTIPAQKQICNLLSKEVNQKNSEWGVRNWRDRRLLI
jgi:hypothetical protein